MTELKPCPFCGEPVKLDKEPRGAVNIHCKNRHFFQYGDEFYFAYGMDEKDKVIKEWNSRQGVPRRCCGNCKHLEADMCMRTLMRDPLRYGGSVCEHWEADENGA